MYAISFEISAFLLSLLCFVYCLTAKRKQYVPPKGFSNRLFHQHFQFLMMLLTNMVSSIASVTGVYLTQVSGDGIAFWQYFFHAMYFVFHTTLSLAFGLYVMSVTGTNLKKNKVLFILFFIPYVAAEILVLTNQWTRLAFFMDPETGYHRGILTPLLYGLAAFYVVMGVVFFIKNMKLITRADRIAVITFVIIAAAGIVTQAIKSDWLVELFCESLACLFIMMVLEEKAGHIDQITGLLNRFALSDAGRRKIANKESFDLVLIKVRGVGGLAKRFGERAADEVLVQFAAYLSQISGQGTPYAYRRGEFVTLFPSVDGGEPAKHFANQVLERLKSNWKLRHFETTLDGFLAIANCPIDIQNESQFEDLMVAYATYEPVEETPCLIANSEVGTMVLTRSYEEELRQAIANKELAVYYQPIYSLKKKATLSAEALLRIPSGKFAHVSPEIYIPIAEKTGLIKEIGLFVFEEVCRFLSSQEAKESKIEYIELNLSVYQFLDPDLVKSFEDIRKRYGVPSSSINLEITETEGAIDKEEVLKTIEVFRELGYTLSLDDFGTGYSNFVRMVRCKFENIKIDKSILWSLPSDDNGLMIIKSLTSFIKNQGSNIIQEGVETKEQLDLVESCGCDYVQGFYFSKPLPEAEFHQYLASEER